MYKIKGKMPYILHYITLWGISKLPIAVRYTTWHNNLLPGRAGAYVSRKEERAESARLSLSR